MARPIFNDEIQYYMEVDYADGAKGKIFHVTEDTAFDFSSDQSTYDPTYKDRINQPSYITGKKTTIDMAIDMVKGQEFQDWLEAHEDDANVPVRIIRVKMWRNIGGATQWKKETTYKQGDKVEVAGKFYEATKAGTSGTTAPTETTASVTDGTVTWKYLADGVAKTDVYEAKRADYTMTQNPLNGESGSAIQSTGTLSMVSDKYEIGTFDIKTLTFSGNKA